VAACLLVLLTTGYLGFLFRFETARYYRVLTGFNQGLEKETLNPLFHGATPVAIQTRGISPVGRREIMKERLLAASFCPLPEFESLVGAVTRSVIMQIERPGEEIHRLCGSEILFKWNEMTGPGLVLITLFNNKGIRITEVPVPYGNSWVLRTTGLPGGLYYWRITRDDELIILGKIILH
jgi:hypothetical protein